MRGQVSVELKILISLRTCFGESQKFRPMGEDFGVPFGCPDPFGV
jgi:hypothetical protein